MNASRQHPRFDRIGYYADAGGPAVIFRCDQEEATNLLAKVALWSDYHFEEADPLLDFVAGRIAADLLVRGRRP